MAGMHLKAGQKLMIIGGMLIFSSCILGAMYVVLHLFPLIWFTGLDFLLGVVFLAVGIFKNAETES